MHKKSHVPTIVSNNSFMLGTSPSFWNSPNENRYRTTYTASMMYLMATLRALAAYKSLNSYGNLYFI